MKIKHIKTYILSPVLTLSFSSCLVKQEVGTIDNTIKGTIYRLDVGVGRLDVFPTVDIAIGIGVALHTVHEVCIWCPLWCYQ